MAARGKRLSRDRCFDSAESFLSRYDPARSRGCLIVDIRMGGMTGLELQDRLIERASPLPIVFITGHGDVPMAVSTMKKGAMDFIQKPFNEDALVALVERMLEHARGAFAQHQQAASRDALLSQAHRPRGAGARAHRRRPAQQADRRRPRHQHQDGGGAPRQHHGKAATPTRWPTCCKIALGPEGTAAKASIRFALYAAARTPALAGVFTSETRRARDGPTDRRQRACRNVRAEVAEPRRSALSAAGGTPGLAVMLVGDDPGEPGLCAQQGQGCEETGLRSTLERYPGRS